MPQLWFDPEADAALQAIENDPTRGDLASKLNHVLDTLESNPGDASVRRHRFHQPALWCVTVATTREEWAILWEPHPTHQDEVIVRYLGPASFA